MSEPNFHNHHHHTSFEERTFLSKLRRIIRAAGVQAAYVALLLFYVLQRKETPTSTKRIIIGTLGYLLSPIDFLPDLTPFVGYTDDIGLLMLALSYAAFFINDQVKTQARTKLETWFGTVDDHTIRTINDRL
jgi:uncharacterized membrane protein YkvA (DUF1232 family)